MNNNKIAAEEVMIFLIFHFLIFCIFRNMLVYISCFSSSDKTRLFIRKELNWVIASSILLCKDGFSAEKLFHCSSDSLVRKRRHFINSSS